RREVKDLWADTHDLNGLLDRSTPSEKPLAEELPPLVERLREEFHRVEGRFRQQVDALAEVMLPGVWRDMDDALTVPFWDEQRRARLLTNLYRTSRRFLIETAGADHREYTPSPGGDSVAAEAKDFGRRQGELALDVLGERWFNEAGGPGWEDYAQV